MGRKCRGLRKSARSIQAHQAAHFQSEKLPNTFTVKTAKKACADPLTEAKISFFCSVASALEPFLRRFQTDAPMVPFLHAELFNVLLVLMKRFIKRTLMDKATTPQQPSKLDVSSKESLKEPKDGDAGTEVKSFLSKASISANEKLLFQKEFRDFLVATVAKIFEKSPLRHKITRAVASIVPATMINARSISEKRMEILVQILFERKWLSAVVADKAKAQFSQLCSRASEEWLQIFTSFVWNKERLDIFYHKAIGSKEEFKEIWSVFQIVFSLSHGNARVESDFSVNADMLVENLKEESLIAQRRVYDSVVASGGVLNVNITSGMLTYARQSHSRYQECLKQKREKATNEEKKAKEKKRAAEQIKVLEEKRSKIK